jgi:hypothetical protein
VALAAAAYGRGCDFAGSLAGFLVAWLMRDRRQWRTVYAGLCARVFDVVVHSGVHVAFDRRAAQGSGFLSQPSINVEI